MFNILTFALCGNCVLVGIFALEKNTCSRLVLACVGVMGNVSSGSSTYFFLGVRLLRTSKGALVGIVLR